MTNSFIIVRDGFKTINNRAFKTIPDYTAPTNFKVSINTPDCVYTDSDLTTVIPLSGTESVDTCASSSGWSPNLTNILHNNSVTYKPDSGTDGSIDIVKLNAGNILVSADKATTSVDGSSKNFTMWIYIKDSTALAKLNTATTAAEFRFGSDNANYYSYQIVTSASLTAGWNWISAAVPSGFTTTIGAPAIAALDYTYISFQTNNVTDTFAAGDLIYDSIRVAAASTYVKALDSTTFDETDASVTTVSKLTISEANGFLINGQATFNTDATPLMNGKAKFTPNSKSVNDIFKISQKIKLRNISQT